MLILTANLHGTPWAADGTVVLVARQLVLARLIAIDETLDRPPSDEMLAHDLLDIPRLHAPVPDVLGIDHHHWAVAALVEATAVVDTHATVDACLRHQLFEAGVHAQPIAIHLGTILAAGTDEDMALEDMPRYLSVAGRFTRILAGISRLMLAQRDAPGRAAMPLIKG